MDTVLANITVSVTKLKRHFSAILQEAENAPIAVLNHNRPEAYLLSARQYKQLLSDLEDLEDAELIRQRQNEVSIKVNLDNL